MAKKKIAYTKVKRSLTPLQREAAMRNLAKAREAKKKYAKLRQEGFNRDTVFEAQKTIYETMEKYKNYNPELNPAFMQLLDEIGYFRSEQELKDMSTKEYYKYATSLRTFLADPLSDEKNMDRLASRIADEIRRPFLERREQIRQGLMRNDEMSRQEYKQQRETFLKQNEQVAKEAFKLYRQLQSTHAGLILRGQISPDAYGSDNLIMDLFDFVEGDYNMDFDAARAFWEEKIEEQYALEQQRMSDFSGRKFEKFDWKLGESYASFVRRRGV